MKWGWRHAAHVSGSLICLWVKQDFCFIETYLVRVQGCWRRNRHVNKDKYNTMCILVIVPHERQMAICRKMPSPGRFIALIPSANVKAAAVTCKVEPRRCPTAKAIIFLFFFRRQCSVDCTSLRAVPTLRCIHAFTCRQDIQCLFYLQSTAP